MNDLLFLIGGLVILIACGNFLVNASVSFARHVHLSTLVVGVIFVSMGTSAPELVVSVKAALSQHPDISIGNVVGSNIANIALVLAISAIILPIPIKSATIKTDWPIMMGASVLFYVFMLDTMLGLYEGLVFLIALILFIVYSLQKSRKDQQLLNESIPAAKYPLWLTIMLLVGSSVGLVYGADWLIEGASAVAKTIGVSERIISISVIALGTSLPELAASVIAMIKKESDISIGNIIGSNIFNICGVIGTTSVVRNIKVDRNIINFDIFWMLAVSILLFLFILPLKNGRLTRIEGVVLFVIYVLYIVILY
jgi:cation:H+ antiporter